jgi:DNA-binding transcriptional MocR family regulator
LTNVAAPSLPQLAVAEFLESGSYYRHVRRLRATLACQVKNVRQGIAGYFPPGTLIRFYRECCSPRLAGTKTAFESIAVTSGPK